MTPLVALLTLVQQPSRLRKALVASLRQAPLLQDLVRLHPPTPRTLHEAERQSAAVLALGVLVVPVWRLPEAFLKLDPPLCMFVRGDPRLLEREAVAIVGARAAGAPARRWAAERAAEAARRGLLVVSGGARGADAAAHVGALGAGGQTLAYVGSAVDVCYPAFHRRLFERIVEQGGAVVSEHPPGTQPFPTAHAMRNRFIAAHGREVLLSEAAPGSGSLGTAAFARRAGKPVRVAPPEVGGERGGLDELLARGHAVIWEPA